MVAQCFIQLAHPKRIQGSVIEAHLPGTKIGEMCEIQKSLVDPQVVGFAQVIGFNQDFTLLSLLGDNFGLSRENLLLPTGRPFSIEINENIAGSIIDATGKIKGRLDEKIQPSPGQNLTLPAIREPKDFTQRQPIVEQLVTGVRAIDSLLSCGQGQRIGIFAAAGCGKTSLMSMLVEHSEADIYVIALIGERGREVTEFIEELKLSEQREQIILVYSTSDRAGVERCNAAQIATTIAEFFSEQGKNVMLFVDSITRYARALRDVALSMGEPPARRGYPASVFESLPKLLERPGRFINGSITAFYTVLIESEDESDVIGDEVRSILDGHIYLSNKLATKGHYPAIDVLQSLSRVFTQITTEEHQQLAKRFRENLVRQKEMQLYIDLGEYRRGENEENDKAFDRKASMDDFLQQDKACKTEIADCLEGLNGIVA